MKTHKKDLAWSTLNPTKPRYRSIYSSLWLLGFLFLVGCNASNDEPRQAMVHETGSHVMPFDLGATQHIFQMTEFGGIQLVVAKKNNDTDQIKLIRQHLLFEAEQFKNGDFSDPATLHGAEMPGIDELSKNIAEIDIEYSEVTGGAQISFVANDIHLITEIHRWFGAQLSDHGSDATYQ